VLIECGVQRLPESGAVPAEISRESEEYVVPTRIDHVGRILVPVRVNGQGPFRFILDTGAEQTLGNLALRRALDSAQ